MLKVWTPKASREAENKSGITEGYLFNGYSKRKLYCLAETYEELAKLYRSIPDGDYACIDRKDMLYQKQIQETKEVFANHLEEISDAFADVADTVVHFSIPMAHKKRTLIQYLKKTRYYRARFHFSRRRRCGKLRECSGRPLWKQNQR